MTALLARILFETSLSLGFIALPIALKCRTISFSKKGKFNIKNLLNNTQKWSGLKNLDLAEKVSTKKAYLWKDLKTWKKGNGFIKNKKKNLHVVAIDYGIKKNILRYFSDFNCKVTIVSCKANAKDILKMKPNGIFLSNGPGDPAATGKYAIPIIKDLIVDRSAFDRIQQVGGFISVNTSGKTMDANAIPIPKSDADKAFEAAACIGCGACVATCKNGSAMLFVGAKVSQYALLPQGKVEATERVLNMVRQMDEEGFGNCTNTGACEVECPKGISLENIARMYREYLKASMK